MKCFWKKTNREEEKGRQVRRQTKPMRRPLALEGLEERMLLSTCDINFNKKTGVLGLASDASADDPVWEHTDSHYEIHDDGTSTMTHSYTDVESPKTGNTANEMELEEHYDANGDLLGRWAVIYDHTDIENPRVVKINPPPDEGEEKNVKPWEKGGNPLNPAAWKDQVDPKFKSLAEALERPGGKALVQGKGDRGTLINPAPDDTGGAPELEKVKKKPLDPDKELMEKLGADPQQGTGLLNDIGLANWISQANTAYIQLHNPADPGDDYKPPMPGDKKDSPLGPGRRSATVPPALEVPQALRTPRRARN